ncbi:MAG TPA: divalent-cation tolerance protein CutA [Steroidobacteraceae bacterium]|nr:divalent-cation tolerance protein CutA [Steroidobacteraceae bacterium]
MEKTCVVVLTTVGSGDDPNALAATLVTERLAACVNVHGVMNSTYRWKAAVESAYEHQLTIKTTADCVPALQARLHQLHGYEVPEFLVMPVSGGSDRYLDWIRESTRKAG